MAIVGLGDMAEGKTSLGLNAIEAALASPGDARATVAALLANPTENQVADLYTALRAWVWKALNGRRRDVGLREWFDLIRRIESYVRETHPSIADRLRVLHELIYESISVSEVLEPGEVTAGTHVQSILQMFASRFGASFDRSSIAGLVGIDDVAALRIVGMMETCGLLEPEFGHGPERLRLSMQGELASRDLEQSPAPMQLSTDIGNCLMMDYSDIMNYRILEVGNSTTRTLVGETINRPLPGSFVAFSVVAPEQTDLPAVKPKFHIQEFLTNDRSPRRSTISGSVHV